MTRVRILAALAAIVLAVGVLPASAQEDELDESVPEDEGGGLLEGLGGDDDGEAADAEAGEAEGEELPEGDGARFIATADGGGFDVQLADERLTVGLSEVGVQSSADGQACGDALACASAAGETLLGETAEVALTEGNASDSATAFDLDELQPLASGGIGEAAADANVSGGVTGANARGGALDLTVTLTEGLLEDEEGLQQLLEGLLGGEDGADQSQLDELIGELEGMLDLDAEEIEEVLSGAGLTPGAQTQSNSTSRATVEDVAGELVDASRTAAQEDEEGDEPVDELDQEAGEDLAAEDDGEDDGGEESEEPSPEAVTALIEDVLGGDGEQPEGPDALVQAIEGLLNDLTSQPLLSTAVGPTSSTAEDADEVTAASARAHGAQVVLVPTDENSLENPDGLVTLEVGSASASVTSDRLDAEADFDPALARLRVTNPLTGEIEEVEVAPGESDCAGAEPLVICVSVGDGDTTVEGAGAAASANAVSVTALQDPLPQLSVDLAAATAAVNAGEPVGPQEQPGEPEPEPALPVTGGGALVPGLLLLGAGSAGFAALRRRE